MNEKMEVNYKIGGNGKPRVNFIQTHSSLTQFNRITGEKFRCGKTNLFLTEQKMNNPELNKERKFILSLRQEGCYEDTGEYRMAQMNLDKEDLISINNGISKILNDTYREDDEQNNKELLGCGRKYEINYFDGQHYKNAIDNGGHIKTAKGTLINYDSPFTGRFFLENDNGALEIIPMASVVEMREIV